MRIRFPQLSLFGSFVCLASLGCSGGASSDATGGEDEDVGALERAGQAVSLHLAIAESKLVFSSHVESFSISDGGDKTLPCRDREFYLTSKDSLYKDGWSVRDAARFGEDAEGAKFREYPFASCRDDKTEILGWFGKERDIEFIPSEQLLDNDYKPSRLPLILQRKSIGQAEAKYFSCDGDFKKTLVRESENAKFFDISVTCKARSAPTKAQLGPVDFIAEPGPYAAVASYKPWSLPAVASDAAAFDRVRDALLGRVGEGKYNGAMSTLQKTCGLEVDKTDGALVVAHTIDSSSRTRRLELRAADLLGFAEGDVYADPIRVKGEPVGKFAAAEFKDGKGGSLVVRFEANTSLDAKIVRINGSETYCRRLVKE